MKIIQLITGLGIGGAEKVVYDLCKASLNDNANEMEVVVLDNTTDRLKDFQDIGIKVTNLNMTKSPGSVRSALKTLNKKIKDEKFDIVHAHMSHAGIVMSIYNLFYSRIPVILTPHSVDIEGKWRERILNTLKKNRDHDILFSEEHLQYYNKKESWSVLANGIDLDYISEIADKQTKNEQFTFISVARLNKAKNQLFLLECAKKLKEAGHNFKLWLVGDGELRQELEDYIAANNISDVVNMLGMRKDIPELLGQCQVFLLPSKWEGLPVSVLEAGGAKIPVISTLVGSLPDLLSEDRGIAVAEEEYYNQLEYAINNYDDMIAKSKKLYTHLEDHYSMRSVYAQHIKLYQEKV